MTPDEIIAALKGPRMATATAWKPADLLSTGSTVLNMALTGTPTGGFCKGHYFFFVGDSSSGKTFFCLTCLAEASIDKRFDNYRFIYDNVEDGALMDAAKYFGPGVAARLEPPAWEDGVPVHSERIEDFYDHLDDALTDKRPCIYILDSMDALTSQYETDKYREGKRARRGGPKAKGDYGDGKAKTNSRYIRSMVQRLKRDGSILIVIAQTRDNIDAGMFEDPRTRSGGRSLKFYATAEIWSSVGAAIKKTVKGRERRVGHMINLQIKKNRLDGWEGTVHVPMYPSFGIDDVGGCVDYLVREKRWAKDKAGQVNPTADLELDKGTVQQLARAIEQHDLEGEVRELVAETWQDVQDACQLRRKPRYGQTVDD